MKNQLSSPAPSADANSGLRPEATSRSRQPGPSDAAQRQRRPRAPQFGTDRRNQRDRDAHRPASPNRGGEAGGSPPFGEGAFDDSRFDDDRGNRERRKATQDRRQSWQNIHKEALR